MSERGRERSRVKGREEERRKSGSFPNDNVNTEVEK